MYLYCQFRLRCVCHKMIPMPNNKTCKLRIIVFLPSAKRITVLCNKCT